MLYLKFALKKHYIFDYPLKNDYEIQSKIFDLEMD